MLLASIVASALLSERCCYFDFALPGVRIYRQRLTDPVDGCRGDVVFILNGARVDASIDGERFRGTLLRADDTTTELEVLLGDARTPPEIATRKPPVAARMRPPRLEP